MAVSVIFAFSNREIGQPALALAVLWSVQAQRQAGGDQWAASSLSVLLMGVMARP